MTRVNRFRIVLHGIVVVLAAAGIGARLYQLQIQNKDRFRERAEVQHQDEFTVQAKRGLILDRNGRELAISLDTESLFVHPWGVEDPARAAELLSPALKLPRRELLAKLKSERRFVWLRRFLDADTVRAIRALELPLGPGKPFGFETEPRRFYPRGRTGVHVVGYANIDGEGIEGVERRFDDLLRGDPTVWLALKDARSGVTRQLLRAPERESQDLVLTIDLVLQHLVERELDQAMRDTGAKAATGIVLVPASGQLLALANRPAADPNRFGSATDAERVNRALVHIYEPGSTFKFVPMSAALEAGRVHPSQRIYCERGLYTVGRRKIHDGSPHELLTPRQILAKSSNIGMVKVAHTLNRSELHDAILGYGFGNRTGIELPGESPGLFSPAERWSDYSQASLAFGQEIGVTAIQMASALGALANDGVQVAPRVALGWRDSAGRLHRLAPPVGRHVVSPWVAREVRSMLESVVQAGTSTRAAIPGYRVAGKSGTAQKAVPGGYSETDYIASFGGMAPADDARVVVLVVLDTPAGPIHQGGRVAAPVFARIMRDALRHLRVPSDAALTVSGELGTATKTAQAQREREKVLVAVPNSAGRVPDVSGLSLREAVSTLAAHGYRSYVRGSGVVVQQRPAPGTELAGGATCVVRLSQRRVAG